MKKLLFSVVCIAIFFIGCGDDSQATNQPEESKIEVIQDKEIVTKVVETVKKKEDINVDEVVVNKKTSKQLYKNCAGCHGNDGSKEALGKSEVIKYWDKVKIENALNGYKNGTYGGTMKGIMKGQVLKLSSKEISQLSEYITKF